MHSGRDPASWIMLSKGTPRWPTPLQKTGMWPASASPPSDGASSQGHLWSSVGQASPALVSCSLSGAPKREDRHDFCWVRCLSWVPMQDFPLRKASGTLSSRAFMSRRAKLPWACVPLCDCSLGSAHRPCFQEWHVVDFSVSWVPGHQRMSCPGTVLDTLPPGLGP